MDMSARSTCQEVWEGETIWWCIMNVFWAPRFSDCLRKYTKDPVELCQNPASPYRRGDLCKGLAIAVVSQQQVLVNEWCCPTGCWLPLRYFLIKLRASLGKYANFWFLKLAIRYTASVLCPLFFVQGYATDLPHGWWRLSADEQCLNCMWFAKATCFGRLFELCVLCISSCHWLHWLLDFSCTCSALTGRIQEAFEQRAADQQAAFSDPAS